MTAELISPGSEEFGALFHSVAHSVFRLETLQVYRGQRDLDLLGQFLADKPRPPDPIKAAWTSMIASNVQAGKAMQRVHVVREPLSDYLRFELTWGYEPNVTVGEDVLIIPIGKDDRWPVDLPQHDYWLFDSPSCTTCTTTVIRYGWGLCTSLIPGRSWTPAAGGTQHYTTARRGRPTCALTRSWSATCPSRRHRRSLRLPGNPERARVTAELRADLVG